MFTNSVLDTSAVGVGDDAERWSSGAPPPALPPQSYLISKRKTKGGVGTILHPCPVRMKAKSAGGGTEWKVVDGLSIASYVYIQGDNQEFKLQAPDFTKAEVQPQQFGEKLNLTLEEAVGLINSMIKLLNQRWDIPMDQLVRYKAPKAHSKGH